MKTKQDGSMIRNCKERGEWAELCFMARAAGQGLKVSKPYGDSASYDVGVEHKSGILRVQVKSTLYCRRNGEYSLNVMGPGRGRYKEGTVDFFAVYLIPIDAWYIVPYAVVGRKNLSLHFTPESRRHKYARYREAWELLRGQE
jgi:PD-(D/E)XK endonuclease